MSRKTIDNEIWPTYRSVAPLWAAHLAMTAANLRGPFPCSPDELGVFLAVAEDYRKRGEAGKVPCSPQPTILRPGETVSAPPSIELPPIATAWLAKPIDYSKLTAPQSGKDGDG